MKGKLSFFVIFGISLSLNSAALSQESNEQIESPLLLEASIFEQMVSNLHGGQKEGTLASGEFDLVLTLDTEKSGLWEGGSLVTYFLGYFGEQPSKYVGDMQGTSNIEGEETFRVFEAYYEQSLYAEQLTALIGLRDVNAEFSVLEYAQTLFNGSFGIGYDISQVTPSLTPDTTAPALELRWKADGIYAQGIIQDGTPGDPNHSRGTRVKLGSDDGIYYATELGLVNDPENNESPYRKYGLGYWYHTKPLELSDEQTIHNNWGVYFIGERRLCQFEEQDVGIFVQIGYADDERNAVSNYYGGGLTIFGPISGRSEDTLSLGFATAKLSSMARSSGFDYAETSYELTYKAKLLDFLYLQPDLQYVVNPGADPLLDDAWVFTLRMEMII
ncbi:MAG: carbohydrate porin [Deltaproteobacteria bacterium]|nr:carbohydrate porin [Deltaproteobacteria bacterium]